MKKKICIFFLILLTLFSFKSNAQIVGKITYSDTFNQGQSYCPASSQYSNWGKFRSQLDSSNYKFTKLIIKGTYDVTGKVCSDSFSVRKLAAALKNPSSSSGFTISCGGNTWVVSTLGTCYSNGSCAITSDNVGIGADGQTNACNCISQSYQIRPTIGNANWGGINTSSCPGPNQRMTLEFEYRLYSNDIGLVSIGSLNPCVNPNALSAKLKNTGTQTIDSLKLGWSINGVFQNYLSIVKKISSFDEVQVQINSSLYFNSYTRYKLKVWTQQPNGKPDDYKSNDTIIQNFYFTGTPNPPRGNDTSFCGSGMYYLNASSSNINDSVLWYNSKTGSKILGIGNRFRTDFLMPGKYKYYISSAGQLLKESIQTNFIGGNQQAGFMLDLVALKTVTIDSFGLNIGTTAGTSAKIEIYYREGSYVGNETNASSWNVLDKKTLICKGTGAPTFFPVKFNLIEGKTYAFYFQTTNAPNFYLQYGNLSSSVTGDDNLIIKTGIGNGLNFGTIYPGRNGNIRINYKTALCQSSKDSIQITINPKPHGADIIKSTPFFIASLNTKGTLTNPDITKIGQTLNYEIKPPTGYDNTGYGNKWEVVSIKVLKPSLKHIPNTDTLFTKPVPGKNGKISITPSNSLEDSLLKMEIVIRDILGFKCDTILTRYVYIAPSPIANFSFKNECDGIPIQFNNLTKIKKGSINYKWEFGTGDSSNLVSPVYKFPKYGSYMVKLTAISNFGIRSDTIIKVTLFEVPQISFKVINACQGDSLKFINTTSIGNGKITFRWDFGDGSYSSVTNPSHLYFIPGSYLTKLDAIANGCSSSLTKMSNQFEKPKANFSYSGNCRFNLIKFENRTSIGLGENFGSQWKFENGKGNNEHFPEYAFQTAGTKTVKYIATSQFGCQDSVFKTIEILDAPNAQFSFGEACNVKPVEFHNNSTEPLGISTSYSWDFGDGNSSIEKNPSHKYNNLGNGIVTLKAIASNGCSTNLSKNITILPQPEANFEAIDACSGSPITFTNKTKGGGIINYKWKFGDGDSSILFSPVKRYKSEVAQTYNVSLTAFNSGGCKDVITKAVNIKEVPKCGFTYLSTQSGGLQFQFIPNQINYKFYQWSFEGGGNSNLISPIHSFPSDGKYKVQVLMTNSEECTCVDSGTVINVNQSGIGNLKAPFFELLPNPSAGQLNILLTYPSTDGIISIYNTLGQLILIQAIPNNEKNIVLNLDLSEGIYIVSIKVNTTIFNKKLVISKDK